MRSDLRRNLTAALKSRDSIAIAALRSAIAAIDNAEAVPADHRGSSVTSGREIAGSVTGLGAAEVERRHLSDFDMRVIVQTEVQERSVAADEYEQLGHHDRARRLLAEADVLKRYVSPYS